MNRLQGISYNKEQWTIKGSRSEGYKIINNQSSYSIVLEGDTVAIEQISDDTFLIYFKFLGDLFRIYRLKITDNKSEQEYIHDFYHFAFLTDNTILFDNKVLYSISKNTEISIPSENTKSNYILASETPSGRNVIYVEHKIYSTVLNLPYVIVIIDAETFKPVTQAFSSIRNKLITLSDDFTLDMLIAEDQKYADTISDCLFKEDYDIYEKGKNILFSQCPIEE